MARDSREIPVIVLRRTGILACPEPSWMGEARQECPAYIAWSRAIRLVVFLLDTDFVTGAPEKERQFLAGCAEFRADGGEEDFDVAVCHDPPSGGWGGTVRGSSERWFRFWRGARSAGKGPIRPEGSPAPFSGVAACISSSFGSPIFRGGVFEPSLSVPPKRSRPSPGRSGRLVCRVTLSSSRATSDHARSIGSRRPRRARKR